MLYLMTALTILFGWLHAPWWAAVASSCILALLLFREDTSGYAPPGEEASWALAETLTNILIGGVSGVLAFALGRGISLIV